jgi:hypothetical protein
VPGEGLSERLGDGVAEGVAVGWSERAELPDDEGLFQGGEDGLDGGGFEQPCGLPILKPDLAQDGVGAKLGGDTAITTTSGLAVL